jgi:hypothetical protein
MRGKSDSPLLMFYAIDIEDRIRPDHPLRPIKAAVDAILDELNPLFDAVYAKVGRPSVPPEVLRRALVLPCLYSVRSAKQLAERLDTNPQDQQHVRPRTLGADKGYGSGPWMVELERRGITPHAAMRNGPVGGAKGTSASHRKNRPNIAARQYMIKP